MIVAIIAVIGIFWKPFKRWYIHYRNGRNARWSLLMDVQSKQTIKLDSIIKQLYPNGGSSVFDKVDQVLDNQEILKQTHNATLYLDSTPIFKTNMNGECIFVNVAWLKLSGYNDPKQAYGFGWLRSIHPDDRERLKEELMESVESETQLVTSYRKINVTTKDVFNMTAMTKIVRNSKRKAVEIIGVLQIN